VLGLFTEEYFLDSLKAYSPKSKPELAALNCKAFELGYNYEG
jgi:hypothetical protein